MKIRKLILYAMGILFASSSAHAQGTFQNLNFEAATLGPPLSGPVFGADYQPIGLALPDWNASIGGVSVTNIVVNTFSTGQASIDLFGPGWKSVDPGVIDGNYTVFLQSGGGGNVSLWQNGTIPAGAQSLQFSIWDFQSVSTYFAVSFGANTLSPIALYSAQTSSGQDYTVYGANIAQYAGQTGQLEFTSNTGPGGASWTELDDISFSSSAVPEPNTAELVLTAATMLGLHRWPKRGNIIAR